MLKIGITGGIGSGKSTICKVFELLGVPVFNADEESKKILDVDLIKEKVVKYFGTEILAENEMIDRKKLASIVFNNSEKLEFLNKIMHPAVGKKFEDWCKMQSPTGYVLKEAAILFESGAHKQVDKVIMVSCPVELRIQRLMNRDKTSVEEIKGRIAKQMDEEEKLKLSDFVIVNDEKRLVIEQVLALHMLLTGGK